MSDNRIPKSRLNQIAQRKLQEWNIPTTLKENGERLEGVIQLKESDPLLHPVTGERIQILAFVVEGHDKLVLLEPKVVQHLPPQPFYDHMQIGSVIRQIQIRLNRRAAASKQLVQRLQSQLSLPAVLDENSVQINCDVELTGMGVVVLQGNENGLHTDYFIALGHNPQPMQLPRIQIDLNEFSHRTDLELLLSGVVEKTRKQNEANRNPTTRPTPTVQLKAAKEPEKPKQVTLGQLYQLMGEHTLCFPGLVLQKDLKVGDKLVRFAARYEQLDKFSSKVATTEGVVWSGEFQLYEFPGIDDFVAGLLGTANVEPNFIPTTNDDKLAISDVIASEHQLPVVSEVWVMNVLIEGEAGNELRYVGIDIDGQPFGAPRVLPRDVFEKTFIKISHGVYRLPVEILEVTPDRVTYIQLDSERNRIGEPRPSRLAPFLSNFIPEAASY